MQNLAEDRKRIPPSFSLNSNAEYGKRNALRRSCRFGSGLIVEIDVKGRRRVSWERNKGGGRHCGGGGVSRACKQLGKGLLGVGSNMLAAH